MSFILLSSGVEDERPNGGPVPVVWPPVIGRERLPPFPAATGEQPVNPQATCWSAKGDYKKGFPANIPSRPDRRWHRGNFCGVSVPGFTGGYNDQDRSLIMSWELPTFSNDDQQKIVDHYARVCGYTHIVLSIPQSHNQKVTIDRLIAAAIRCKQAGLFVEMIACSDGEPFSAAIPWLDALDQIGALDLVCGCWQVDKWYEPEAIVQLILDNGAWSHERSLLTTIHWGGGYPGWAENCAAWNEATEDKWGITDRWTFQAYLAPWLDGHNGQCNTEASIDEKQSWLNKALVAMPYPMYLCAMETNAQGRYGYPGNKPVSGPGVRPEVWGDLDGLLCVYADPEGRICYGNGARRPDGTVL